MSDASEMLHWGFDDLAGIEASPALQRAKFRRLRDEIDSRIHAWLRAPEGAGKTRWR
jgi:hypothetical protein